MYVGANFIIDTSETGITIKLNDDKIDIAEEITWDELIDIIKQLCWRRHDSK